MDLPGKVVNFIKNSTEKHNMVRLVTFKETPNVLLINIPVKNHEELWTLTKSLENKPYGRHIYYGSSCLQKQVRNLSCNIWWKWVVISPDECTGAILRKLFSGCIPRHINWPLMLDMPTIPFRLGWWKWRNVGIHGAIFISYITRVNLSQITEVRVLEGSYSIARHTYIIHRLIRKHDTNATTCKWNFAEREEKK